MAITCPQCGAEYDVTLFTFDRRIRCDCGAWVDLAVGHQQTSEDVEKVPQQATMPRPMEQPTAHVGDMTMTTQLSESLEVVAKILLRCWMCGFLLLLTWFGFFMVAPSVIYSLHGRMFGLSPHELNVIHYSGMAFMKFVVILFFFFPWLAVRLVLRKNAV
ncbi:MAG: DUF6868 family protein [Pirellulaceae bacterium]